MSNSRPRWPNRGPSATLEGRQFSLQVPFEKEAMLEKAWCHVGDWVGRWVDPRAATGAGA